MLAFITTLRHPQNSADYCRVESLLQDTLASLSQQSCDDYRGLIAARDFGPEYVMAVDADDFVHRDVAAFPRDHLGRAGWVVKRGWIYSRARNAYAPRRSFFRICGTSFIIPFDAYDVPPDLTVSATQREIAEAVGERLENVLEHGYAFDWWRKHGRVLEPLPFPGAVYQVDTGENHSGNFLVGPALPYRSHLYRDFAVRPSKSPAATIWTSVGPRSSWTAECDDSRLCEPNRRTWKPIRYPAIRWSRRDHCRAAYRDIVHERF